MVGFSFGLYGNMNRTFSSISSAGWTRIYDYEYKLAGENDEVILRRPVKKDQKGGKQTLGCQ